ncbi:hypothetical protein NJC08_12100 [Pseudomonas fluorescens]|jgi:hypothetical protein|uniref:hypothetical protein n=1 Tax=Pseudomonas TaxID=286 RepID=UPI000BA2D5BB|nr:MULTISPECIES: hypothetical protein [Pseudomonas]MCO7627160.1 hypothetical protein [Pseudomonas fluorescens]
MASILLWLTSLLACIGFAGARVHKTYTSEAVFRKANYKNGFILVIYSALIVGTSGWLGDAIQQYQLNAPEISYYFIILSLIVELTKYLTPFIFAGIGVNLISHALTS